MHIAIDARIINSSTGRYVERLLTYLQDIDSDNQYSVIVPTKDRDFWKPKNSNFTVITADFSNYSLAEQFGFKRYLNNLSPDLVHFCMPQQPVSYKGKSVTTFHDLTLLKTYNSDKNWLVFHVKQFIGRFIFLHVAKKTDHILCPSEFTKQDLINFSHVNPSKITVTYESADINTSDTKPYPLDFKQFILYVGQQSDYKNIKRLGDAHQSLLQRYPDLGLVLAGRKKADALANERYFNKLGYKKIIFTDFIPDDQLGWLYQNCAVYAFPSLMEGFGLPGLEAMGYSAPVAASNASCIPEILGDAALYFDPLKTEDIANKIDEIMSNDGLKNRMIEAGHNQLQKYSWQRMAEQTHAVYINVLTKTSEQ